MELDEIKDLIDNILSRSNYEKQQLVAMEECAELIQAISKNERYGECENLVEEIADVLVMIIQLCKMNGISRDQVVSIMFEKLERQLHRLDEEQLYI